MRLGVPSAVDIQPTYTLQQASTAVNKVYEDLYTAMHDAGQSAVEATALLPEDLVDD